MKILKTGVLALMLTAGPVSAGDLTCENAMGFFDKLTCHTVTGLALVAGGAVMAVSSAKNAVSPGTPVKVKLDDGTVVPGVLTAMATGGRHVENGDTIRLDRTGNHFFHESRMCSIAFERRDVNHTSYARNFERYGEQSGWSILVSKEGVPDKALLSLGAGK